MCHNRTLARHAHAGRRLAVFLCLCTFCGITGCAAHRPGRFAVEPPGQAVATQPADTQPVDTQPVNTQASTTQFVAEQEPVVLSLATLPSTLPATQPAYDTTLPQPVPPRDFLERWAMQRGPDLGLVDRLMDKRTEPPAFDRTPPSPMPADARIAPDVPLLDETNPFPEPIPLPPKEVTVVAGIARSTYRTRTPAEVYSAAEPFLDIVQRDVNMRSEVVIYEDPRNMYFDIIDGKIQLAIAQVFDVFLIRSWVANSPGNRAIPLLWAQPANPYTTPLDAEAPGPPGTSVLLLVAKDAPYRTFADLKGARLALPAHYVNAPGAFLTRLLQDAGQPLDQPFFGSVTLRLYSKDAAIDVLHEKADVACVDEGTLGSLANVYGLDKELRVLAASPHYNIDITFTTANNVVTHETQIELAQRMMLTMGRDPEGQEVLFFFDTASWNTYREEDLAVAADHFEDFLQFYQHTPADLKPLLDPRAPIDRKTYTRYGDE